MLFRQVIDLPEHSPEVLCVKAEGVAKGSMVLLHGFPDTNWGWRKLLIPLSKLGFDVYAPTQRGYGPTDKLRLTKVSDFAMEKICQDVAWLLDFFLIDRAIVVGHDWGGTVAWQFAAHYPTRVQSVCVFCTPFTMPNPQSNPWEKMQRTGMQGRFAYQMVFQSDYAVELLERNLDQTLRVMMRGPVESEDELSKEDLDFLMAVRLGQPVPELPATTTLPHPLLTQTEVLRYKMQFAQSGFLNPVRWYRNVEANWKWNVEWFNQQPKGFQLKLPALMVTAERDEILTPSMAEAMRPHFTRLEIANVLGASHWVLQEQPQRCVELIAHWLAHQQGESKI